MSDRDSMPLDETPTVRQIPYGDDPNQFGRLATPNTAGPHPVVVFIHGGFWRAAYDLEYGNPLCADLTRLGIATWNLEYRRVGQPGGGWPGTLQDVATGLDHLRVLAPRHHLDLSRVVTLGHSAGGHLALWLAARQQLAAAHMLAMPEPVALRAAIALAGVVDLHQGWEMRLGNNAVGELLGGGPTDVPDSYAGASPAAFLPLGLPQILFYGTADRIVPLALGEQYYRAAREHDQDVTLVTLPGSGHFEMVTTQTAEWNQVVAAVVASLGMESLEKERPDLASANDTTH